MKTCPSCNRAYDDETITFCLYDGSVLTTGQMEAPPTQRIEIPRTTDPSASAPPQYADAHTSAAPPTIASPQLQHGAWAGQQQQQQVQKKRSGKIWIAAAALLLLGAGVGLGVALMSGLWSRGDSVARKLEGDDKAARNDKSVGTSNTMLRPTPTPAPTPTPTPDVPTAEKLGMVGNWGGTLNGNPTSLVIQSGQGNSFSGTRTQGDTQVSLVGTIDPETRRVQMRETRVLKGRPYSNGTGWSLGTENGTLSADGRKMSGKGKDQYRPYTWSFSKK